MLQKKEDSAHLENETRVYRSLANFYLEKKNLNVQDLRSDFKDGSLLVSLVESLINVPIQDDNNPVIRIKNTITELKNSQFHLVALAQNNLLIIKIMP